MKLLTFNILFILVFVSISCTSQEHNSVVAIEYKAVTRGSSLKVHVIPKELTYSNFEGIKKIPLTNRQWNKITKAVSEIPLDSISFYNSSTSDSASDRALIASIKITVHGEIYESNYFDHGNPPAELSELVKIIFEYLE